MRRNVPLINVEHLYIYHSVGVLKLDQVAPASGVCYLLTTAYMFCLMKCSVAD
jgi:hypothetical protein